MTIPHACIEENHMVKWSSQNGKGTGGELAQKRRIKNLQTNAAVRSKQLTNIDAATQGEDINPMAPHFDMEPESSQVISSHPSGKP